MKLVVREQAARTPRDLADPACRRLVFASLPARRRVRSPSVPPCSARDLANGRIERHLDTTVGWEEAGSVRPPSPTAEAIAGRLVAAPDEPEPGHRGRSRLDASVRAVGDLAEILTRWFGAYGYHALLARAVAQARRTHPALAAVTEGEPLAPALGGLDEAAAAHGVEAAADGIQAVLTAVIALLGRIVGDDMVMYLVEPLMDVTAPAGEAPSARPAPAASAPASADGRGSVDARRP